MGTHKNRDNDAAESIRVMASDIILAAHDAGLDLVSYLARMILEEIESAERQAKSRSATPVGGQGRALDGFQ